MELRESGSNEADSPGCWEGIMDEAIGTGCSSGSLLESSSQTATVPFPLSLPLRLRFQYRRWNENEWNKDGRAFQF